MNWKLSDSAPLYGCLIVIGAVAGLTLLAWLLLIAVGTAIGAVVW